MMTEEKILSFKDLGKGWVKFEQEDLLLAAKLNQEILNAGFITTDAFPGLNGEVRVTFYFEKDLADFYGEFTLSCGVWDFILEVDGMEVNTFGSVGLSFDEAVQEMKEVFEVYLKK